MKKSKLTQAFALAAHAHEGQFRKGTKTPYISHPMVVAGIVAEHGGTELQIIAALLHDVIEDSDYTFQDIKNRFGPKIAQIVRDLSDTETNPKPAWKKRKEDYLIHLKTKAKEEALLVSAADKVHNARAINMDVTEAGRQAKRVWARFSAPKEEILWYYQELFKIYQKRMRQMPKPKKGLRHLVNVRLKAEVDRMKELVLSK